MYCSHCAQAIPAEAAACSACGQAVPSASAPGWAATQEIGDRLGKQAREASGNAWMAFRTLAVNPVGGLPGTFASLGASRALQVAVVFAVFFDLCFVIGAYRLARTSFPWGFGVGESWFGIVAKLVVLGVVPIVASTGALLLARKLLRGQGSPIGDFFIATTALLPQGVAALLSGVLGAGNPEVIAILVIFALCLSVLLIHQGCREVSRIGEPGASLAVPVVVLLSLWLSKILMAALN
jgi:hypothetical protein